jgi:hypothetical protein
VARAVQDGRLDFSAFTEQELAEAICSIDERKFPLNYARLNEELKRRGARIRHGEPVLFDNPGPLAPRAPTRESYVPRTQPQRSHVPQKPHAVQRAHVQQRPYVYQAPHVHKGPFAPNPAENRAPHLIVGSLMVGFGAFALQTHAVLHVYAATACAAAGMVSVIASYFGERGNEENYQSVATACYLAAAALGINALVSLA